MLFSPNTALRFNRKHLLLLFLPRHKSGPGHSYSAYRLHCTLHGGGGCTIHYTLYSLSRCSHHYCRQSTRWAGSIISFTKDHCCIKQCIVKYHQSSFAYRPLCADLRGQQRLCHRFLGPSCGRSPGCRSRATTGTASSRKPRCRACVGPAGGSCREPPPHALSSSPAPRRPWPV